MTTKIWYSNKRSYDHTKHYEINSDEVITVPDDAMSIKELVKRSQNGIDPEDSNYGYFDVEHIDQISRYNSMQLDFTDLDALQERNEYLQMAIGEAREKKAAADKETAEEEQANNEQETTEATEQINT